MSQTTAPDRHPSWPPGPREGLGNNTRKHARLPSLQGRSAHPVPCPSVVDVGKQTGYFLFLMTHVHGWSDQQSFASLTGDVKTAHT